MALDLSASSSAESDMSSFDPQGHLEEEIGPNIFQQPSLPSAIAQINIANLLATNSYQQKLAMKHAQQISPSLQLYQPSVPVNYPQPNYGQQLFSAMSNPWLQHQSFLAEYQKILLENVANQSSILHGLHQSLKNDQLPPPCQDSAAFMTPKTEAELDLNSPKHLKALAEKIKQKSNRKTLQKVEKLPKKARKLFKNTGEYGNIANIVASNYCLKKEDDSMGTKTPSSQSEPQNFGHNSSLNQLKIDEDQPLDLTLKSPGHRVNSVPEGAMAIDLSSPRASCFAMEFPSLVSNDNGGGTGEFIGETSSEPVIDVRNHEVIGYADSAKMPRSRKECRKGPGTARNLKSAKLWELLLWLLSRPDQYSAVIQWRNRSIGFFKLLNDDYLLDIYNDYKDSIPGRQPSSKKILYSSITRALRHYYWNSTLHPTPKRKTYQFGPNATGWQKGVEREHALQSLYQWEQIKAMKSLQDPGMRVLYAKYGKDFATNCSDEDQNDVTMSNESLEKLVANYSALSSSTFATPSEISPISTRNVFLPSPEKDLSEVSISEYEDDSFNLQSNSIDVGAFESGHVNSGAQNNELQTQIIIPEPPKNKMVHVCPENSAAIESSANQLMKTSTNNGIEEATTSTSKANIENTQN